MLLIFMAGAVARGLSGGAICCGGLAGFCDTKELFFFVEKEFSFNNINSSI